MTITKKDYRIATKALRNDGADFLKFSSGAFLRLLPHVEISTMDELFKNLKIGA